MGTHATVPVAIRHSATCAEKQHVQISVHAVHSDDFFSQHIADCQRTFGTL